MMDIWAGKSHHGDPPQKNGDPKVIMETPLSKMGDPKVIMGTPLSKMGDTKVIMVTPLSKMQDPKVPGCFELQCSPETISTMKLYTNNSK